jgi:hypothetical protein
VDLAPKSFRGSAPNAEASVAEELVLDGQQRITAGLELFYDLGTNHYFVDLRKVETLATERAVDLDDKASFLRWHMFG